MEEQYKRNNLVVCRAWFRERGGQLSRIVSWT